MAGVDAVRARDFSASGGLCHHSPTRATLWRSRYRSRGDRRHFRRGMGIAQVLFGLSVASIGIALTFSIVLGISAAVGSVIPLIRLHPEKVFSTGGLITFAGVALVIIGVTICAVAGRRREAAMTSQDDSAKVNMSRGLAFAILCGFGAALVNFGLAFGGPLLEGAKKHGAAALWAGNAVWLPLMLAGSIPNFAYCFYLLSKNKTADRFSRSGTASYWFLAAVMAFFWFASPALYGIATGKLGSWGTILGWPLFMSLIVITASILGFITAEWKGSGRQPLRIQVGGVVVLVMAVFVLAAASRWDPGFLLATPYKVVDLGDEASQNEGIRWWEEMTASGGEGMVVKPFQFVTKSRRGLVQPAVKCRGREYLRIIYGPEYTAPEHLERLRSRGLGTKRSLALREFAISMEALQRFVEREPLRRVHECVFGVLALESEPVDPRL